MSYHGMPGSGADYGSGYAQQPSYPPQQGPGRIVMNDAPGSPDVFIQALNTQQMQYPPPGNHGVTYYQDFNHALPPNMPPQSAYYPAPSFLPQQYYPQYNDQFQQPQMQDFQQRFIPQYDGLGQQQPQLPQAFQVPQTNQPPQTFHAPRPIPPATQPAKQRKPQIQKPPPSAEQNTIIVAPVTPKKAVQTSTTQSKPNVPQTDPQTLLLALAEEYFEAAHNIASVVAPNMGGTLLDTYQALIATGLGCLEASLKNKRLAPRMEAKIRLRYAGVLLEETQNFMEAETALSKGITLCEQNRYIDLKYTMQVLLVRLMYSKTRKTSLKALDTYIADAEAYHRVSWIYVFRFLRASLSMNAGKTSDIHAALQNLRGISTLASNRGDHAVFLASSLMEILGYLHAPMPDSVEQIQRALAAANTYQLETQDKIPQLTALTHLLDVICSLLYSSAKQAGPKVKAMQVVMDDFFKDTAVWNQSTNSFAIPINRMKDDANISSLDSRAVLGIAKDGRDELLMTFLPKATTFALSYLLSAIVSLHKSCIDGKATTFLHQGLKLLSKQENAESEKLPLTEVLAESEQRSILRCYFHVYLTFCHAAATDWKAVRGQLSKLSAAIHHLNGTQSTVLSYFFTYLSGICYQGTGDLENALRMFKDPMFSLSTNFELTTPAGQVHRDLAILASLNSLWICQRDRQLATGESSEIIASLETLCANHPNKDIDTAFSLVKATVDSDPAVSNLKIKSYLKNALDGSKTTANTQFLCITLSIMCKKFFVGVVGEQAEKAARAASIQGHSSGSKLWMSVADGMLAQTLETQGKMAEAQTVMAEARRVAATALHGAQ